MIGLATDLVLAFLLVLTTIWCVLLFRRLERLRVERRDIEAFVTAIDAASQRAEAAIAGIRASAADAQRAFGGQSELAQQRVAELNRLVDNAGRMARRIEATLHQSARSLAEAGPTRERADPPEAAAPSSSGATKPASTRRDAGGPDRPRIRAELLRALESLR